MMFVWFVLDGVSQFFVCSVRPDLDGMSEFSVWLMDNDGHTDYDTWDSLAIYLFYIVIM